MARVACLYSLSEYFSREKPLSDPQQIPLGISAIASSLRQEGHAVRMKVLTPAHDARRALKEFIGDFEPRLFCLTAVSTQYPAMSHAARIIKEIDPSIYVAIGGIHPTLMPEEVIADEHIDALCIGEGDLAVTQLAAHLSEGRRPSGINNLWIRSGDRGSVERNPAAAFIADLDDLPTLDRQMWKPYIADCRGPQMVVVGRGCPNNCTYCTNHALKRLAPGKYIRFRSPAGVIAEIKEIDREFDSVSEIYLEADTLAVDLDYTFELLAGLAEYNSSRPQPIEFGTNLAPMKHVIRNRQLLEALRRANFRYINIGFESGSERLRREVLKRPHYSNEDLIAFCALTGEYGIDVNLYLMIGLPTETPGEWAKTIEVARACRPKDARLSIFYPYPGTELHRLCVEQGLMQRKEIQADRERKRPALSLREFPPRKVQREYILFFYKFYKGELSWFARFKRSFRAEPSAPGLSSTGSTGTPSRRSSRC